MCRNIICIIIITSLVLCSTSVAFANPLDPWSGAQANTVTNGVVSIDNTLSNIYTGLSALYNYLKNNGDGVVEGLLVLANRVSNIINTLDYYLPLQNSVLQNLYSFFVPPSGDQRDIWDLLSQVSANTTATSTALNTTNSELLTIDSHVDGVEGSLTSIGGKLDTVNVNIDEVETKLGTANTLLYNTNSSLTSINSNVDQVESQLSTINNSINNLGIINWHDILNVNFEGLSNINSNFELVNVKANDVYAKIRFDSLIVDSNPVIVYLRFPVGINDINYFNYINIIKELTNVKLLYYDIGYRFIDVYVYADYNFFSTTQFVIDINTNNQNIIYYSSTVPFVKYLNYNDPDFYYFLDHLVNMQQSENLNVLSDIKNILIDIDKNSDFIQNNYDLQIDVDIDASDGRVVSNILLKLQDLFDTGVGLSQFLVGLNEFDNLLWFTSLETYQQVNYNPNVPGNGYQDLYD